MNAILNELKKHADAVLVDTPPVLAVTDAVVLSQRVDGVLLVVRAGVTKMAAAKQAVDQLRFVGANTIGVVLNGIQVGRSRYGYGYSYHGYYYAYHQDEPKAPRSRWPSLRRKSGSGQKKVEA
jgi:tyrosine-protein kinase Etk/Wzc